MSHYSITYREDADMTQKPLFSIASSSRSRLPPGSIPSSATLKYITHRARYASYIGLGSLTDARCVETRSCSRAIRPSTKT